MSKASRRRAERRGTVELASPVPPRTRWGRIGAFAPMSAVVGSLFAAVCAKSGERRSAFRSEWAQYRGGDMPITTYFNAALGYMLGYLTINLPIGAVVALTVPDFLNAEPVGPGLFLMSILVPWIGCGLMFWQNRRRSFDHPPTLLDDITIVGSSLLITATILAL